MAPPFASAVSPRSSLVGALTQTAKAATVSMASAASQRVARVAALGLSPAVLASAPAQAASTATASPHLASGFIILVWSHQKMAAASSSVVPATLMVLLALVGVGSLWLALLHGGPVDPSGSPYFPFRGERPRGGFWEGGEWWVGRAATRLRDLLPRRAEVNGSGEDAAPTRLSRAASFVDSRVPGASLARRWLSS